MGKQPHYTAVRMAKAMQDIAATGTVDEEALANNGFTLDDIRAHSRAARDIANRGSR